MTDRNTSFAYQVGRKSGEAQPFAEAANTIKHRENFNKPIKKTMIERAAPTPVLKPSLTLGGAVDAAAFSTQRRDDHDHAKRRAFIAQRTAKRAQAKAQKLSPSFNQTKGPRHER